MRIAYDHQIFGWQRYGGISRYAYELASGVSLGGSDEAMIIAPLYINEYLPHHPPSLKVVGRKIRFISRGGRILRAINAPLASGKIREFDPDIVHETYYSRFRTAGKRAKIVLTVFDMVHEKFSGQYSRFDPTRAEKAAAVRRADHIVCISRNTQRDLVDILSVPVEKTSVVYLGSSALAMPESGGTPRERPYLFYVGIRGGYKNFSRMLRAYAQSARLRDSFDVVCFGGGPFTPEEFRLAADLALPASRLRQVSGNDSAMAGWYARAAAFIYPSVYEGFGIPPLEAMSVGCPVICSNSSSMPEVVGDATESFDPLDEEQMKNAIENVVFSDSRRQELIARGRERCAMFSWRRCSEQTLDIYRGLGSRPA